jgi:hypothetical protein
MHSDPVEHRITARPLCHWPAQRVAPPGKAHLPEHRFLRPRNDPRQPAVKLKSDSHRHAKFSVAPGQCQLCL